MAKKSTKNFNKLKAALILRGTNLTRWAADRGYPLTTVWQAAAGKRAGVRAVAIRQELEDFTNA